MIGLKYWRWTARSVLRKRERDRHRHGGWIYSETSEEKGKADVTLNLPHCP